MTERRSSLQTFLLATGFAGLLFITSFSLLGLLAPGYNSLRDTISALEFTSLGAEQRANFFVFGLLLCAFAAGLRTELGKGRGAVLIPAFQALAGIGVIGDAIFIDDPMHLVCDLIAFNSSLIVLFLFAWRLSHESRWKGWSAYSIVTAFIMMAFLTAFGIANHLGGPAGLMEKLASCIRILWSAWLTARLLTGKHLEAE